MDEYYRERAPVYDIVYQYPERQADLRFLEEHVEKAFRGKRVLEVAAGTGYWTEFIARSAHSILATDQLDEPLEVLRQRMEAAVQKCPVTVATADAYNLAIQDKYDAAFAGLILSHIPVGRVHEFFESLHKCLSPGAIVVLMDNSAAQCERLPITRTDEAGNTFQMRTLDSGAGHEVLKNFPDEATLRDYIAPDGEVEVYLDL